MPKARPFKAADWFRPLKQNGRKDHERMPNQINGVYAIRNRKSKRVYYVGESHEKRLRTTLQRHLQIWLEQGEPREIYKREDVEVAWRASRKPLEEEADLIRHYKPRDNTKGLELDFEQASTRRKRADFDDSDLEVSLTPGLGGVPF